MNTTIKKRKGAAIIIVEVFGMSEGDGLGRAFIHPSSAAIEEVRIKMARGSRDPHVRPLTQEYNEA